MVATVILLLTVDASRRAWFLPTNPYTTPFSVSVQGWRDVRDFSIQVRTPRVWASLAEAADGRGIIVDHPNYLGFARQAGGHAVPLLSPAARSLFGHNPVDTVIAQLRNGGIRFVVLTRGSNFTPRQPRLHELTGRIQPVSMGSIDVYDLILGPFTPMAP